MWLRSARAQYLIGKVLDAPLWAMMAYLPFVLVKELCATQAQLTLVVTLKPLLAVGSVILASTLRRRLVTSKRQIIWCAVLGRLPLFLFPFVQDVWFCLLGFALYVLMDRGIIPPWMERLKTRIPVTMQTRTVSDGALARFFTPVVFSLIFGAWMDVAQVWGWLYAGTACMSLVGLLPLMIERAEPDSSIAAAPVRSQAVVRLLLRRKDFALFQGIFFLGGMGIMMYQPLLPRFCIEFLKIDYAQVGLGIAVCKGIGFAVTGRLWAALIRPSRLYTLAASVAIFSALTPLLLSISSTNHVLFYVAFFVYGVMQGGSEPIWHLSGPLFAGEEDSGPYTNVNVLAVGIRGAFAPALGTLLASLFGVSGTLVVASSICALGGVWGFVVSWFSEQGHQLRGYRPLRRSEMSSAARAEE